VKWYNRNSFILVKIVRLLIRPRSKITLKHAVRKQNEHFEASGNVFLNILMWINCRKMPGFEISSPLTRTIVCSCLNFLFSSTFFLAMRRRKEWYEKYCYVLLKNLLFFALRKNDSFSYSMLFICSSKIGFNLISSKKLKNKIKLVYSI
jgi:hypothetical protein